jgi:hypothetical protein
MTAAESRNTTTNRPITVPFTQRGAPVAGGGGGGGGGVCQTAVVGSAGQSGGGGGGGRVGWFEASIRALRC